MFKGMLTSVIFIFWLLGNAGGCGASGDGSGAVSEPVNNAVLGIVKDMTGLDGCKMMIILPNGDKLQPVEIIPDFELKAGQKIRFTYKSADVMSICMAGKTVVITSIELER